MKRWMELNTGLSRMKLVRCGSAILTHKYALFSAPFTDIPLNKIWYNHLTLEVTHLVKKESSWILGLDFDLAILTRKPLLPSVCCVPYISCVNCTSYDVLSTMAFLLQEKGKYGLYVLEDFTDMSFIYKPENHWLFYFKMQKKKSFNIHKSFCRLL
ncbi:hypothetical protein ILYODFUR_000432 [Ilyodon furcidens]|uniref:Uncharacterized protein n=1 Tax=Ilyodon furcidens TaxID=33524 RepID=A0ABV0TEW8_9TELE